MRVAALYDIHANLPALESVLREVRQAGVDQVVIGGDVLPGPMPRETIALLRDLDIPTHFIAGNGEREVVTRMPGLETSPLPPQAVEAIAWTAQQLDPQHQQWLAAWPATLRLPIRGLGEVLFCHGTPRSDSEIFTRLTPEDRLLPSFAGLGVQVVVCGHSHMQFDRMIGNVRVVNAGSVGMPFGEPGADWLLLGSDIHLRHTTYDLAAAAERVRQTSYPQARDFAERYILKPPSEQEMLAAFTPAGLR